MNNLIGLKEFRENVEAFTKKVRDGHSFIILKKSKPVFKVSPIDAEEWEEVIDFTKIKKGGVQMGDLLARL